MLGEVVLELFRLKFTVPNTFWVQASRHIQMPLYKLDQKFYEKLFNLTMYNTEYFLMYTILFLLNIGQDY